MKGIECALIGRLTRDAELRRSQAGREWMWMTLIVGEGDGEQHLTVGSWSHTIHELAPVLTAGTELYIEGKIKLRSWEADDGTTRSSLSVQASVVQPLALIGQKKPKRTRAPAKAVRQTSASIAAVLPFNDDISYIGT